MTNDLFARENAPVADWVTYPERVSADGRRFRVINETRSFHATQVWNDEAEEYSPVVKPCSMAFLLASTRFEG